MMMLTNHASRTLQALRAISLMLASVILSAFPAEAQPESPGEPADTVPVVLTVSGAVSLGSYQGGVHWGLVEFIRRSQDDPRFRDAMGSASAETGAAPNRIPSYRIAAAAGASAGNINSVLTAIEWCRAAGTDQEPEQSLLWRTWIRTGWEQLFPVVDLGDWETNLAIFTRRYYDAVHQPTLDSAMVSGEKRPGCRVPIGITITRLQPDSIALNPTGTVSAATQRFASVLDLTTSADRLTFRHPRDTTVWNDPSLGRLIRLPGAGGTDEIPVGSVMQLVEASSAFPVAFAPVHLTYEDPAACQQESTNCGTRTYAFTDGGVFDNNPLDLAYGLYRHLDSTPHPDTRVVYIDVDRPRGKLAQARATPTPVTGGDRGIGAVLSLLGGALPTARQYELQSLARAFARDSAGKEKSRWIRVTDRSYPVVGEHLGYFAAFLGRPFREYDFYIGIYDGLHFAAQDLVCGSDRKDGCTARVLGALLEDGHLPLGPVAPRLLDSLYFEEYGRGLKSASPALESNADQARALFADALFHANRPLLRPFYNQACARRSFTERLACAGGLGLMLNNFATPAVENLLRQIADRDECQPERWQTAPDAGCLVDETFWSLIRDHDRFFVGMMDVLLHQTWRVEDRLSAERRTGTYGARDYQSYAEVLDMAYRSTVPRTRGRMPWDPSTIPDVVIDPLRFLHFFPYYVGTNLDAGGWELGYRPTIPLGGRWSGVLPIAFNYHPEIPATETDSAMPGQLYFAFGNGVLWKPRSFLFTGVELSTQFLQRRSRSQDAATFAVSGNVYLVGDKLRIGARYLLDPTPRLQRGRAWGFTLGIADANGLIYWILRTSKD